MNKLKYISPFTILFALILNGTVHATSVNFVSSESEVYVGDDFSVNLTIDAVAAWNLHISSTGAVEGCTLDEANTTDDAKNATKTFIVNCRATAPGAISVILLGDYTTEDSITAELSETLTIAASERSTSPDPTDDQSDDPSHSDDPIDDSRGDVSDNPSDAASPNTGAFIKTDNSSAKISPLFLFGGGLAVLLLVIFLKKRKRLATSRQNDGDALRS